MYKALLFDLDNTLVDRDTAVQAYYLDQLRSMNPPKTALLDELLLRDRSGQGDRSEFLDWYQRNLAPDSTFRELTIAMRFGIVTKIRAFRGLKSMLKDLGKTYKLGVLSNGSGDGQRLKLEASGLVGYFDPLHVWISGEMHWEKPDGRAFQKALEQFGLDPGEVLMIGDDPVNDIGGAAEVGMATCWVSHGKTYPGLEMPDHVVEKTALLPSILSE